MTKRKKQNKTKENKRAKEGKKYIYIYIYIYILYKLLFMIRGMLSAYSKRKRYLLHFGTCCIFKTKRVKKFRTLETDGELSYISPALW